MEKQSEMLLFFNSHEMNKSKASSVLSMFEIKHAVELSSMNSPPQFTGKAGLKSSCSGCVWLR